MAECVYVLLVKTHTHAPNNEWPELYNVISTAKANSSENRKRRKRINEAFLCVTFPILCHLWRIQRKQMHIHNIRLQAAMPILFFSAEHPKGAQWIHRIPDECHICNENRIFLGAESRQIRQKATHTCQHKQPKLCVYGFIEWRGCEYQSSRARRMCWAVREIFFYWIWNDWTQILIYSINRTHIIRLDFFVIHFIVAKYCIRNQYHPAHEFAIKKLPYENGSYGNCICKERVICDDSAINESTNLHLSDVYR